MKIAYKEDIATVGRNDEQLYLEWPRKGAGLIEVSLMSGLVLLVPTKATSSFVQDMVKPRIEMVSTYQAGQMLYVDMLKQPRLSRLLSARMRDISALQENWDGYGASAVPNVIVRNARTFLRTLQEKGIEIEDPANIYPTPYGTVVIEVTNDRGLVSMEIDHHRIGFFTDYRANGNWGSEGIETDFKDIPEQLQQHLS